MNPVLDQTRHTAFQQTLLSARRTMMLSEILKLAIDSFAARNRLGDPGGDDRSDGAAVHSE
jgi:hypothetical protein